jgi:NAD(P)H dehydrogenase (quinone)
MIIVTGATGKLGQHAVEALLGRVPASELAVAVRNPDKARTFAERGITVRHADYSRPETLRSAFGSGDRLLLISGSEVGQRVPQHQSVIDAAKAAGVRLIAYTSILHGDASTLALASEHIATERAIRASGVPFVLLRNSWYFENYTENLAGPLGSGVLIGSAGDGRIAAAARADYAAAAARVVSEEGHANQAYDLAGDVPFTMSELAAEIARQSGKAVVYKNLSRAEHVAALVGFGLPAPYAEALGDADAGISRGELDDASGTLRRLIGRPTTSLADAVKAALRPAT